MIYGHDAGLFRQITCRTEQENNSSLKSIVWLIDF